MIRKTFRRAKKSFDSFGPVLLLPLSLAMAPGLAKASSELVPDASVKRTTKSQTKDSEKKQNAPPSWTVESNYFADYPEDLISIYEDSNIPEIYRDSHEPGSSFRNNQLGSLRVLLDLVRFWQPGSQLPKLIYSKEYYKVPTYLDREIDQDLHNAQEEFFATNLSADSLDDYLQKLKIFIDKCLDSADKHGQRFKETYAQIDFKNDVRGMQKAIRAIEVEKINPVTNKHWELLKKMEETTDASEMENLKKQLDEGRRLNLEHMERTRKIKEQIEDLKWSYSDVIRDLTESRLLRIFADVLKAQYDFLSEDTEAMKDLLMNYYILEPYGFFRYADDLSKEWLDLMPTDYYFNTTHDRSFHGSYKSLKDQYEILPKHKEKNVPIEQAIDAYHSIPKASPEMLDSRIDALKHIVKLTGTRKNPIISEIADRAKLKADYLETLKTIPKNAEKMAFRLPEMMTSTVVATKGDKLHDLDPAKRHGMEDAFAKWYGLSVDDPSTPHFFLWLETQDASDMYKDLRHSMISVEQKRVLFDGPSALNELFKDEKTGLIEDGRYVYNIDENGDLYILPAFETDDKFRQKYPDMFKTEDIFNKSLGYPFNHDVVLGGKNILVAGVVQFKDGKIEKIDTNSGHYKPKMIRHLRPALSTLLAKHPGVINSDTIIGDYDGKVNMPYSIFLNATTKDVGEPTEPTKEEIKQWRERALESKKISAIRKVFRKKL